MSHEPPQEPTPHPLPPPTPVVRRGMPRWLKWLGGTLLGLLLLVLLLIGGVIVALRIPSVQTNVAHRVASILTEKLQHKITIGRVDVRPFSHVLLDSVRVLDYHKQELFNISRLDADISVFSIFEPNKLTISDLRLREPRFRMVTYAGTDVSNFDTFIRAIEELLGPSKKDTTKSTFDFRIEGITLDNGRFIFDNGNDPPQQEPGFDYAHMYLDSIYGQLTRIELFSEHDSIRAQINGLRTIDRRGNAHLRDLNAYVSWTPKYWTFKQTDFTFNRSRIVGPLIRFDYRNFLSNFPEFNDSVKMTLRLAPSHVKGADVAVFAPQIRELFARDSVIVSGRFDGKVNNFRSRDIVLDVNSTTHLHGNFAMEGLPEWQETYFDLNFRPSVVDPRDVERFIPDYAYKYVGRLGVTNLKGQFTGFYNDFVTNGTLATALGTLTTDLNLKIKPNPRQSSYSGRVRTEGFQLGRLIGQPNVVQVVSLDGSVKGVGFDPKTIRLETDVRVASIGLLHHIYRGLQARGTLVGETFTGQLGADDASLRLQANGVVTYNPKSPAFNLKAHLARADLRALGLSKKRFTVSTDADLNFRGLSLDDLMGSMVFRNTQFQFDTTRGRIDTLDVASERVAGKRTLTINSEVLDLQMAGDYRYSTLIDDVTTLIDEYRLNFEANPATTAAYYHRKAQRPLPDYRVDVSLQLHRPNQVLCVFLPELSVADNTRLDGFFRTGQTSIFSLGGDVQYVSYGPTYLAGNHFEFNTSKLPYSDEVLADAFVTSRQQEIPGLGATEKMAVETIWNQGAIDFTGSIRQQKSTNSAELSGSMGFLTDAVEVRLNEQSGVNLLGRVWRFAPANRILIAGGGDEITIGNLALRNGYQQVAATGRMSAGNPAEALTISLDSFRLATLNPLMSGIDVKFSGLAHDSRFDLSGVFSENPTFNGELHVDSLRLDSVMIGEVDGTLHTTKAGRLGLDLALTRGGLKLLNVDGSIAPSAPEDQQLSLHAALAKAPLKLVEPFLDFLMSDLRGEMNGQIDVIGALSKPILRGNVDVRHGRFRFDYLNTVYRFSGPVAANDTSLTDARISFDKQGIHMRGLVLRDQFNNQGTLDGTVYEQGFQDIVLDIRGTFRRLMVLNTSRRDNDLYFGTAFGSGRLTVSGTPENLNIRVDIKTDPGTRLAVPLDNQVKVARSSYIKFVSTTPDGDKLQFSRPDTLGTKGPDLSGLVLDMNVDVTPDGQLEVIFDERTGDIIRGTGQGRVNLAIDTRGNFNMYGNVEIVRGLYNFTLLGVVNKEFIIRPGGTISWNGDPYAGELNLTATYTQKTSLQPILASVSDQTTSTNTIFPVVATMGLKGSLMAPEIKLGLDFSSTSNASSSLQSVLEAYAASIRNDEQELNRQVFSLLVLKRLSPQGEFNVGGTVGNNAFASSVGELLSTQLSYWISQIDSNLEIDLGLAGFDQTALQAMQVRVSYSFMQGRLRVTREGGISSGNNSTLTGTGTSVGTTTGASQQALGDISLEYYIRPDGHLRLKLAYETTSRDIQRANTARQAASIVHTEQADTFGDFFRSSRPSKRGLKKAQDKADAARRNNGNLPNADDDPRPITNPQL